MHLPVYRITLDVALTPIACTYKYLQCILASELDAMLSVQTLGTSNKVYVELCTIYIQFLGTPKLDC